MSGAQKAGLRKEHELAADIYEATEGRVIPLRSGWSGNQAPPSPDLLIPFEGSLRAIEVKKTGRDKCRLYQDDVEDIQWWAQKMQEVPTHAYLAIRFNRRCIYLGRLHRISNIPKSFETFADRCPFDAHVTYAGNLTIEKPTTDQWPSASQSDDAEYMLTKMHQDTDDFEMVSVSNVLAQIDQ